MEGGGREGVRREGRFIIFRKHAFVHHPTLFQKLQGSLYVQCPIMP